MARDVRVENLELFAWVGEDSTGEVGLLSMQTPLGITPVVTAKRRTAAALRGAAVERHRYLGQPVRLVRFVYAAVLEEIA